LLRLREGEVNLREQTRLVDEQKTDESFYKEAAERLAGEQRQLMIGLHDVQRENRLKELELPLRESKEGMEQVGELLDKPATDESTAKAETGTIESLSDAINLIVENSKKDGGSQGGGESEMSFVMQMMSQEQSMSLGMSQTGGGSFAGGSTDRAPMPMPGGAEGEQGEARSVKKAGGTTRNLPAEFRDALQNYFNAIEQEQK
jgi:hypothetical protein